MKNAALVLSIIALIVGGVAYWRSGGKEDVALARQEIEVELQKLEAKQKELADSVAATTSAAYENLQERMRRAKEQLAEIRKEASEKLQAEIDLASQQLVELQNRVADGIESMKDTTVATARMTEEAIAQRVHRLEARVDALQSKLLINRALVKANKKDFDGADECLREAVALIKDARQKLGTDAAYDKKLNSVAESLRLAVAAVKAQAEDIRTRIEKVVTESDTLVAALESDEQKAEVARKTR
jgi:chromosome segregation ATPase